MQEREFQNMFIFAQGFEAATLKIPAAQNMNDAVPSNAAGGASSTTRKQIIGFAKFRTKAEAIIARDMLAARRVDAEKGSVLKAEMAKKNLHTKRGLLNEPIPPAQQSMTNLPANLPPGNSASQQALQSALQNPGDNNPPISTLYIGLPSVLPSTSGPQSAQALEDSLRNLFSHCPGYRRLSFRQKANNNICHVEFDSVEHASRTKDALQGNTLGGLVKTGIRISYSKNPLGIRSGSLSNGSVSPGAMSPTGLGPTDLSLASFTATSGQGRRPSESLFSPSDYNHYYNRSRGTMRSPDAGSSTSPPPLSLGNSNFNSFSG
ncbi:hypothetical protein BT69DRAFT_1222805 [Atractiella rhizophila]|nr:hypothetical protein BT69DRAFT_1222805 [Atractiella rhizophila]